MTSEDVSDAWLNAANERYRQLEIPPIARPFKALSELSIQIGSIHFDSPVAKKVFSWFQANTKPGSHAIGAMYVGAFYFDACFWPVTIPIGYGTFSLNPVDSLQTMPAPLKATLWKNDTARKVFLQFWVDCFDYAYGLDEVGHSRALGASAAAFLANADRELKGAVAQLLPHRPNLKAILNFGMAIEIFLKAFLIHEKKLAEQSLKKLGHNIAALAKECHAVKPLKEFQVLESQAAAIPDISERYDGDEKKPTEVFDVVFLAQMTAATLTRHLAGRDSRSQIFGPAK